MFNRSYEEAKHDVEIPWLVDALKTKTCIMESWQSNYNAGETTPTIEMRFTAYEVDMASFPFFTAGSSIEYNAPQYTAVGSAMVMTASNYRAPYVFTVSLRVDEITDDFLNALLDVYDVSYSYMGRRNPYKSFVLMVQKLRTTPPVSNVESQHLD